MDFRDPIARFGDLAVVAMVHLSREREYRRFAIRVISHAAEFGNKARSLAALDSIVSAEPDLAGEVTAEKAWLLRTEDSVHERGPSPDTRHGLSSRLREIGELKALGYSLDLGRSERWNCLTAVVIPRLGTAHVVRQLEGFVALRRRMGNRESLAWAIQEWEHDIRRIHAESHDP